MKKKNPNNFQTQASHTKFFTTQTLPNYCDLPNIANASIARYIKPIITDEKIANENGIGRRTSTKNITSIVDQSDSFFINREIVLHY